MSKPYLLFAFIGMLGYSLTALLAKLATATGRFSGFFVMMVSASVVVLSSATIALYRGDLKALSLPNLLTTDGAFLLGTGLALAVAVVSYFYALSIGPASVVVPVFGMFIVGGAVLGLLFLHEPLTPRKAIGIVLAVASIYLIAGNQKV